MDKFSRGVKAASTQFDLPNKDSAEPNSESEPLPSQINFKRPGDAISKPAKRTRLEPIEPTQESVPATRGHQEDFLSQDMFAPSQDDGFENENEDLNKDKAKLTTILNLLPFYDDCKQKRVAYESCPDFFQRFLTGKLGTEPINLNQVIRFLTCKECAMFGNFIPCMFLVELELKILSTDELLDFFKLVLKQDKLPSLFLIVTRAITLQQCQLHLDSLTKTGKLPLALKSFVDYEPITVELKTGCKQSSPTDIDLSMVTMITTILQEIVKAEDSTLIVTAREEEMAEVQHIYRSTIIRTVMDSLSNNTFKSVYDTMMSQSLQLNYGNISVYLKTTNAIGVDRVIRLYNFDAEKHGLEKVNLDCVPTVHISPSGIEHHRMINMLTTDMPRSEYKGKINYTMYKMAKKMGVKNIRQFLFGKEQLETFATTLKLKKDTLIISIHEKLEDLFESNINLSQWLSAEEQLHFLTRFNKEQVLWLLKHQNVPFSNEFEVYTALVAWAFERNNIVLHAREKFKYCSNSEILNTFREIYPECLCMLDLQNHVQVLIEDGFVEYNIVVEGLKKLRDPSRAPGHCAIRHRHT